jgi:diguanylate cyclase (GGDEF)-like protein/PAS domain S-box-containing protein
VKRFPWFRFRAPQDDFNSAHPPGADSRWSSILAIASLIASGVAAYLLQGSSSARAGLSGSEIDRWMWTLVAILGVQMAYQQLRMTRLRRYLRRREALFRIVTENAADMIALVSAKGRRLYNSPAYQKILGYTAAELSETSSLEQVHPDDRYKLLEASRQAHETGIGKQMEYRIRHKNGSWLVFESKAGVIRNQKGEVDSLVIVNRDITSRKHAEEELARNSLRDPLTGLPNRPLLFDRLQHCHVRACRDRDFHYALLVLDLDGFKDLNRVHGRAAGDELLVQLSRRFEATLRLEDTIARSSGELPVTDVVLSRTGGDEFLILLEGLTETSDALRVAERIRKSLADPFLLAGNSVRVTASIGVTMNTFSENPDDLMRDAHSAMVRAHNLGGARCELYDTLAHERAVERLRLESDLHASLDLRQLELFYQPILRLDSGRIVSFEALVRWHHPRQGLVSPFRFLQTAEDIGLMIPIGRWVLEEACRQLRAWQLNFAGHNSLSITVNVSARQFAHEGMISDVRSALQKANLEPPDLHLEITESMAMADLALSNQIFSQLRRARVSLTIDDFGVGSSSLSRLQNFPADALKLDRTFLSTMLGDPRRADIVGLIVALAHNLDMEVIAEGIETPAQLNRLRSIGCELGQGYLFSRPLSVPAAEKLLAASVTQPDLLSRQQGIRATKA